MILRSAFTDDYTFLEPFNKSVRDPEHLFSQIIHLSLRAILCYHCHAMNCDTTQKRFVLPPILACCEIAQNPKCARGERMGQAKKSGLKPLFSYIYAVPHRGTAKNAGFCGVSRIIAAFTGITICITGRQKMGKMFKYYAVKIYPCRRQHSTQIFRRTTNIFSRSEDFDSSNLQLSFENRKS